MIRQKPHYVHHVCILFLAAGMFLFSSCSHPLYLTAKKGVIDLSHGELKQLKTIHLDGEWELYWNKLHNPDELARMVSTEYAFIPGPIRGKEKGDPLEEKTATCRLMIKVPADDEDYGLILPRFIGAQTIWINGKQYIPFDYTPASANSSGTYERHREYYFPVSGREIELVIQLENFYISGSGFVDNIIFGKKSQIIQRTRRTRGFKFLLIGALLLMAIYHLGFFSIQHKDMSTLFFALFNLSICLRTFLAGENFFFHFWPQSFSLIVVKMEFISIAFLAIFNVLFLYNLFTEHTSTKVITPIIIFYVIQGLCTIILPLRYIFYIMGFHIIIIPIVFIYTFYITIKAIKTKREGSILFLLGSFFLLFFGVWDILKGLQLHHSVNLLPLGFLIFTLFQSILLGKRLIRAFAVMESFSAHLEVKVAERTLELEKSHSTIMESLHYARTIQFSILPNNKLLQNYFSDYFILYNPREVVGGDLYWFKKKGDSYLLALLDCTGHGVPGALMTMTVNSILLNITESECFNNPARILQLLNTRLRDTLQKESDHTISDAGLDIGIVYFDGPGSNIIFSGAKISLFYMETDDDRGELIECVPDKQSVGYSDSENSYIYTNHEIKRRNNMQFYLTTDGLIDQCGGKKGLPFGKKKLIEMLEAHRSSPMQTQKAVLKKAVKEYRSSGEPIFPQLDDVTVIGFKI